MTAAAASGKPNDYRVALPSVLRRHGGQFGFHPRQGGDAPHARNKSDITMDELIERLTRVARSDSLD